MPSPLTSPNNPSIHQSNNPAAAPLLLQPIPLSALAALLGCTRSTIRHYADRLGFRYTIRRLGPRGQRLACLTPEQAQSIATELERETSSSSSSSSSPSNERAAVSERRTKNQEPGTPKAAEGHFYLLQLEPKHDPGRFKLGFSSDLDSRLDDLRTVVPLARLIAAWPAQRSWERIAIVSTAQNAEPLSQEVFRTERLEDIVAAADRFFAVMPQLSSSRVADSPWNACTRLASSLCQRWFPPANDSPPAEPAIRPRSEPSAIDPPAPRPPSPAGWPRSLSRGTDTVKPMSAEPITTPAAETAAPPEGAMPITEFHREIATELFNQVLGLLHRDDRTCAENDRMIHAAHASRFHWEFGGTPVNIALGEWQCAKVHTAMGQTESALHHAWRYLEHSESYGLGVFHIAHAHATVAAALAKKDPEQSAHQLALAEELMPHVTEEEEQKLLAREFEAVRAPREVSAGRCC